MMFSGIVFSFLIYRALLLYFIFSTFPADGTRAHKFNFQKESLNPGEPRSGKPGFRLSKVKLVGEIITRIAESSKSGHQERKFISARDVQTLVTF